MIKLQAAVLREIAQRSGVGERGIERMLGSLKIEVEKPAGAASQGDEPPAAAVFDLGLRLDPLQNRIAGRGDPVLRDRIGDTLRSYLNTCPIVAGWVCRGDFDPRRVPADVTYARLLHANRTAGRLRAALLRGVNG